MWLIWPLLLWQGCLGESQFSRKNSVVPAAKIVVRDLSYYRDAKQPIQVDIVQGKLSANDLRAKILLVSSPSLEEISGSHKVNAQLFSVRLSADGRVAFIKPREKLKADTVYGLYIEEALSTFVLAYTFAAKPPLPQLIKHDVGEGEQPLVSDRRTRFSFYFDKPIAVEQSTVALKDLKDQHVVPFERVELSYDQKIITVILEKGTQVGLKANHVYGFFLDETIAKTDKQAPPGFIAHFQAVKDTPSFFAWQKPVVSASESSAHLSLQFNKPFVASWYVQEELAGLNGVENLGQWVNAARFKITSLNFSHNMTHLATKGLKAKTRYQYVARIIHEEGGIVIMRGNFTTSVHNPLRIAQIMVNPKVKQQDHEQDFEYIKIVNIDKEKINISNLILRIENLLNGHVNACAVVLPHTPLAIAGGEEFLVVGQGFQALESGFGPQVKLVRLKQATLCGGLVNTHARIISIHEGDDGFIDRYGGHLWPSPEGYSIKRIDLEGLDEVNNYCYLPQAELTPRPSKSLCGT